MYSLPETAPFTNIAGKKGIDLRGITNTNSNAIEVKNWTYQKDGTFWSGVV